MLLLEHAAVYTPRTVPAPAAQPQLAAAKPASTPGASKTSTTRPAAAAAAPVSTPLPAPAPAVAATTADPAKRAPAPAAPQLSGVATKASDYERLTAMLKSMGLGLHKLDPAKPAPHAKLPPAPATPADVEKPAVLAKASPPAPARAPSGKPATAPEPSRAREDSERVIAPEPARAEARPAEATRAGPSAAASSAGMAPRMAIIADARACTPPAYPVNAHRNGESGTVQLALLVGSDGRVVESKVQKSSGSSELDRAARKALSQCKFKAAGNNPQADPVWTMMEYVFSLE